MSAPGAADPPTPAVQQFRQQSRSTAEVPRGFHASANHGIHRRVKSWFPDGGKDTMLVVNGRSRCITGGPMAQLTRRRFLKASSAATASIATASVAAPAIAQSMPEIRWRLVASWPRSIDVPFGACETVAKYIAEAPEDRKR